MKLWFYVCACLFILFLGFSVRFFLGGEEWFGDKVDSYNGGI